MTKLFARTAAALFLALASSLLQAGADAPEPLCGGIQGLPCGAQEFCDFQAGICGAADQTGLCMPKPDACTREYRPVCGCDGKTYGNDCERRAQGVSKLKDGAC